MGILRLLGLASPWGFTFLLSGISHHMAAEDRGLASRLAERLRGGVRGMHRPVDAAGETRRVTATRDGQISLVKHFIVEAAVLRLLD
jgi:hypothetical protein